MATLDPRDPRNRVEPQVPPDDSGWNADLPSQSRQTRLPGSEGDNWREIRPNPDGSERLPLVAPRRNDEDYGPIAPEPKWEKPVTPFNRERFLLYLVAWILFVQFGILILAGAICGYGQYLKFGKMQIGVDMPPACPSILDKIKESAGESLAVLLALLGGGTIAVGEYQRRHPPGGAPDPRLPDPRDPRNP